jgi:asparagine synthase (glutamine-hydrolysing)
LTGQAGFNRLRRALKFSRGMIAGGASASDIWRFELTREDSLSLLREEHRSTIGNHPQSSPTETVWNTSVPPVEAMREADLTVSLRDEMLPKIDRAGMASGLEGRVPLLDDTFVEAMLAVPASAHTAGDRRKALLRKWAMELCPEASIDRPKHGFDVPIADWLKSSLYDDSRRLLLEPCKPGLVDPVAARKLWERMKVGVPGAGHAVYALLMAELWFEHRA